MKRTPVDMHKRRAGVLVPLSALRSEKDCGVGDVGALKPFFDWMNCAGLSVLQFLPLNDLSPLDCCPYSSISAFAFDPVCIDLDEVPGLRSLSPPRDVRASRRVRFAEARAFKMQALEAAFSSFEESLDFRNFVEKYRHWLDDYALFRVLKEWSGWESWTRWPLELRERQPAALEDVRRRHSRRLRFYQYVQWLAFKQWQGARKLAAERGILFYGDIPFGLNIESADVWARQREFDFSCELGAPPDQFSAAGQSWGLPAYRWREMEAGGHDWWRRRVRHAAELYDIFRLDHAVGLFRSWTIALDGSRAGFDVTDEGEQRARGERFLRMVLEEAGAARPVAEDLGIIPHFTREVLAALEIPGYKVTRWEPRGDGFCHPRDFPRDSVAAPSNHDTSTLIRWWREASAHERSRYWEMVTARREEPPRFSSFVHERLLENVLSAHSALVVLLFQDVVASRARINVPGTVGPSNWTYRIPWNVEGLLDNARVAAKTGMLRRLNEAAGRATTHVASPEKTC